MGGWSWFTLSLSFNRGEDVAMKEVTVGKSSPGTKGVQYSDAETLAGGADQCWEGLAQTL